MMTIKNGKFYQDGKVVPIEFGNKEQINLIRKAEKALAELSGDGGLEIEHYIEEETTYNASYYFKCVCGNRVEKHSEADDEDDLSGLTDTSNVCRECKRVYSISYKDKKKNKLVARLKHAEKP